MSSKVKITRSQIPVIRGTKVATQNAQILVSTGIPTLDNFIGGGVPVGSLLLVQEDAYSTYSNVIFKYFIAEGIVNNHSVFLASQDMKPSDILTELPAIEEEHSEQENNLNKHDDMKIAWRYQNMKLVDSSPTDDSTFGHYYDLSKKINQETLNSANVNLWDGENVDCENNIFENDACMHLLMDIEKSIFRGKFLVTQETEKRNVLRIGINSLGSRLWLCDSDESTENDLFKFLYMFKAMLRQSFTAAIVTIPIHNFDDSTGFIQRIEHLSDVVISLSSFADSPKETNPIFKDYHGLLKIKKIPTFNTLSNQNSLFSNLGFKLRRKKLVIEILHLPPEFDDTTQREQDDVYRRPCGGGTNKSKLDF